MAQPRKKIVDINQYLSKEFLSIENELNNNGLNVNEITTELFVSYCLNNSETTLYNCVNSFIDTETISKLHNKIFESVNFVNESGIVEVPSPIKKPLKYSKDFNEYLIKSIDELNNTNSKYISSDHVLLAILKDKEKQITKIFNNYGMFNYDIALGISQKLHNAMDYLSKDNVKNEVPKDKVLKDTFFFKCGPNGVLVDETNSSQYEELLSMLGIKSNNKTNKPNKNKVPYCDNINDIVKTKSVDELIGCEKEIKNILTVLSRRKSNNVILVGDTGVGKTQIVYGLTKQIVDGNVPTMFKNKTIYKFNASEMIAGTTLRGMMEERMVSMVKSLKYNKNSILFIDDIHNVFSKKQNSDDYDCGGIISELLTNGDVQVIATTTYKGYKTLCDLHSDLSKKMQKIQISSVDSNTCFKILNGIKGRYEKFHNVTYSDEIIKECIELSNRYITDKKLPSSAIDIMDEVGSYKKIENDSYVLISKLHSLGEEIDDTGDSFDKLCELEEKISAVEDNLEDNKNDVKYEITLDDLYATISNHTNIPVGKIKTSDKNILKNINDTLKKIIIGQDEAIDIVSNAIKRNKVGLSNQNKPIFSCMLIGSTGVGKTFLAKTLAKEIYGDEKFLVRFDMSEYSDKTSVNKLIGASAGYVGYSEGGLLTETVKNNKYSILLIDEIEKANDEIYNLLLQVLDEGFLTDNTGQKVDFKNTIIILTSNIGTKKALQTNALGFTSENHSNKKDIIEKELKNKFSPEFINRLDEIVYFNNLTENNLKEIIKLELDKLNLRLKKLNMSLSFNEDVINKLFSLVETDKEYGARPILRIIQKEIENKITDLIIFNDYENHEFVVSVNNGNIEII